MPKPNVIPLCPNADLGLHDHQRCPLVARNQSILAHGSSQ